MTSDEALHHCQAYLDRQLDAQTVAQIDACLARDPKVAAAFEEERTYHAFLKTRSAAVAMPRNLVSGIKEKLAKEQSQQAAVASPSVVRIPARRFSIKGWIGIAAGVMVAGWVAYRALSPQQECLYMVSCASEHESVASGKNKAMIESEDRAKLAAFVSEKLKIAMPDLPALSSEKLTACGAGISSFASLKQYGSPDAAYVMYDAPNGEKMTLFIHPWANEEPEPFNKMQYNGKTYWAATHGKNAVAVWKSDDKTLVLSLVSKRSKDETLRIAEDARRALSAQKTAWIWSAGQEGIAWHAR